MMMMMVGRADAQFGKTFDYQFIYFFCIYFVSSAGVSSQSRQAIANDTHSNEIFPKKKPKPRLHIHTPRPAPKITDNKFVSNSE